MSFIVLLGLSLDALASNSIVTGVAGNFAHELTKLSFKSVIDRATKTGAFPANHDLQRAVRRASLLATSVATQQFAQTTPNNPAAARWTETYASYLAEEIRFTRLDDYAVPSFIAGISPEDLLGSLSNAPEDRRKRLAREAADALCAEVTAWHQRQLQPLKLTLAQPPAEFLAMLRQGWLHVDAPLPLLLRLRNFLTRPRGRFARAVRRGAPAEPAVKRASWFPLFAGFFAEELKENDRLSRIFDAQLLARIGQLPGGQSFAPNTLTQSLQSLGEQFTTHFDRLRQLVETNQQALLKQLLTLTTAADRDAALLREIKQDTGAILTGIEQLRADVRGLARPARSGEVPFDIRAYSADRFFGRADELRALATRLAAGRSTVVVGPAGLGKTALAAAAICQVAGPNGEQLAATPFPAGVIVLDLYRTKAAPEPTFHALANAIAGATFEPTAPAALRARSACEQRRLLIVFEGAEEATGQADRLDLPQLLAVLAPANLRLVLTRDRTQADAPSIHLEHALSAPEAAQLFDHHAGPGIKPAVRTDILELLAGHPLALTWAASLLQQACDHPDALLNDWRQSQLPALTDPTNARHTLAWLFERSCRGLTPTATAALRVGGRLADAPFPLSVIAQSLAVPPDEAGRALRALVTRSLLRLGPDGPVGTWRFTHVLGYQFARQIPLEAAEESRLGAWCQTALGEAIQTKSGSPEAALGLLLPVVDHALAVLTADRGFALQSLTDYILVQVLDRAKALGSLPTIESVLSRVHDHLLTHAADLKQTTSHQVGLWKAGIRLGDLAKAQGQLPAAERHFSNALALAQRLADQDPANSDWHRDLSISFNNLGDLATAQGQLPAAERHFSAALAIRKRLADQDPANSDWQRDLSVSFNKLGYLAKAQGQLPAAERYFSAAFAIRQRLTAQDPANSAQQRDLSFSFNRLGDLAKAQGQLPAAERHFSAALAIRQRLADQDPASSAWQRDLSVSFNKLGDLAKAQGQFPAADRYFSAALAIAQQLADQDPVNSAWQRGLSISFNRLGDLAKAQGQLPAAERHFSAALAIRQRLADQDPANSDWQRDLAISYERLGDLAAAQGQLPAAERYFSAALTVAQRLTDQDPANSDWQRDLAYSLTRLAELAEKQSDRPKALKLAEASLAIDERLAALDSTNVTWQNDVAVSRALVARLRG